MHERLQYFQITDWQKLKMNVRHLRDLEQTHEKNVSVEADVVALNNCSRLQVNCSLFKLECT